MQLARQSPTCELGWWGGSLDALGAKFEGVLRKHTVVQHGADRDSAYYSVIDDEWPALKTSLQRRLQRASVNSDLVAGA